MKISKRIHTVGIVLKNAGHLVFLTFIRNPIHMLIYALKCLFYYSKKLYRGSDIPQKDVCEILQCNDIGEVKLADLNSGGDGSSIFPHKLMMH